MVMNEEQVIGTAQQLESLITAIYRACDVPDEDARITAEHLVRCDLRGVETHGLVRMKLYVDRIRAGGLNPKAQIKTVRETPFSAVLDGDACLGHVGGYRSMDLAIEKARQSGIGFVAMKNSNHYGMASYYSMMPLPHDMIGISMTNVIACMAPTGGTAPRYGNNPFSIAFPTGKELPVVLDFATSTSSWGKVAVCKQKGQPLPEGCFLDKDGRPTIDPDAFLANGTLLPIAGYKGYGIGLCISLMCNLLSGNRFDTELAHLYNEKDVPGENAFVMVAMKIDAFSDVDVFKTRINEMVQKIHDTPRAPGVDRIWLPGEIEHVCEKKRRQDGIPLNRAMATELVETAKAVGVDLASYEFIKC